GRGREGGDGGYRGRGTDGGDRGRGGYRGGGEYRGGRGGYGGDRVSSGMQSMKLGEEVPPLDFIRPKEGEQSGYKAAPKPAPASRKGKQILPVIFNTWEIVCEDRVVYRYDVSVDIEWTKHQDDRASKQVYSLNKGSKDDATVAERNELIREVIKTGLKFNKMLSPTGEHVSDGASLLYTNEDLKEALLLHEFKITVPLEKLSPEVLKFIRHPNVVNAIITVGGGGSFRIKDFSSIVNVDRSDIDYSVKQFFEIITSEHALRSGTFDSFTGGKLYRADPDGRLMGGNRFATDAGFGQERRPGMFKGFAVAQSNEGLIASLNIDVTTGTFWREGKLFESIMEINEWGNPHQAVWNARAISNTNEKIKGLRVSRTVNGKVIDFQVHSLTANTFTTTDGKISTKVETIDQLKTVSDGKEVPLSTLFPNIKLRKWPLVVSKRPRRRIDNPDQFDLITEYFPIELLDVKANQRVPLKKQGADPVRAMRVGDRWTQTERELEALNLFADTKGPKTNPLLAAFGIHVARKPLTSKAIIRKMPTIELKQSGTKATTRVNEKTTFNTSNFGFETPANISTLFIVFSTEPRAFEKDDFADALYNEATKKGMKIDKIKLETVIPSDLFNHLREVQSERIAESKSVPQPALRKLRNVVFMYIEPEKGDHHDELKLFERKFCITTQHLKMENAAQMLQKWMLMENVLLKLNIKGGGHNYYVKPEIYAMPLWMEKRTMILGYDVCHAGTGQARAEKMAGKLPDPSVVGFSFNGGVNPDSFIGDYHFQQPTKERVNDEVLNARIKWMLGVFEKNRGDLPPLIIVVRDGISEGQYSHGMDELEALREGAIEYAASKARTDKTGKKPVMDYSPDFIFVVATKRHHKRIYPDEGKVISNMPAMSVIDDTITNPALFEFFLQSHNPIQGTAKSTKYTVLKDDVGTNADAMQSLMAALCFEHQISTNAISIPEPVYQSDEWAKRGSANMRKFKDMFINQGKYKKGYTYDYLTEALSYWKSSLECTRVNA
ncbi:hypothetical protein PMAYCL1PPCAC_24525, partial [Pristionchus mayeri]